MTTALPTTMRAVVQDRYGPPDVLRLREMAVPVPGPDEVLVEVAATSLNAADWHVMTGEPYVVRPSLGLRRPADAVPGRDVAGRVAAVGAGVTAFRTGDEVFGRAGSGPRSGGALADYVCASVDHLVHRPPDLTAEQAAAVPLAGNTALGALRDSGELAPGQHVLVHGASGGLGTFAVQIAKALGATVTAVCSTPNVERVRSLGADRVVDYTAQDVTRLDTRYDLVLDLVPHRSPGALRRLLTPGGTLVLAGGGGGRWFASVPQILRMKATAPFVSQRLLWHDEVPSAPNLGQLVEWIGSGQVRPVIDRVYPLDRAAEAMAYLLEGHARGKIVVVP